MTEHNKTDNTAREKLEDQLARDAAYFSEASTALSNRLEQIQKRLLALPAKAEIGVGNSSGLLSFSRTSGGWALVFAPSGGKLIEASKGTVEQKAAVAELLPTLIRQIASKFSGDRSMLASALASLDKVDSLLDKTSMEGW